MSMIRKIAACSVAVGALCAATSSLIAQDKPSIVTVVKVTGENWFTRMEEGVVAYGAAGKGMTMLNYCGIRTDFVDFVVDRNPYKHGRFCPGVHVPVHPVDALAAARPDYVLILPWNLRDEISAQHDYIRDWGGRFVVPIPTTTVF